MNGEEILLQKMKEGWDISIECKGKGRNYEFTYEATAIKVEWSIEERLYNHKHGVGNTIAELIEDLGI